MTAAFIPGGGTDPGSPGRPGPGGPAGLSRGVAARLGTGWLRGRAPSLIALVIAVVLLAPIASVAIGALSGDQGTLRHLAATVLPSYLANTLVLVIGVGLGVVLVGTGTAWLVTMCRFPGRRFFEWSLIVPLAMPAYIIAYAYTDLLSHPGAVQSALRGLTGWGARDYWFPNVRSVGGAVVMFVLVLYPYVYLLARRAFLEQSNCYLDAGRTLGSGPWHLFFRVALPLARPAIAGGAALALMETLADFGTVAHFGVQTFTTGIYKALVSMNDNAAAAKLSTMLLAVVLVLVLVERHERRNARFYSSRQARDLKLFTLEGWLGMAACAACALPVLLGFVVPVFVLLHLSYVDGHDILSARYLTLIANSLTLGALAALSTVAIALVLALTARLVPGAISAAAVRLAGLGYAVPGAVIAVGVLIPLATIDGALDRFARDWFGVSTGLLLLGSVAGLVFAYVVRFMAVALNGIEASLGKVPLNMDAAARVLGRSQAGVVWQIHLPLLRGGIATALLMVFVDTMKELPATLIIRPFNYDTLAIQAYRLASDERLAQASTPALVLVAAGLLPVALIARSMRGHGHSIGGGYIPFLRRRPVAPARHD
ncbi:MAG: ABC transporter permease subunit [Rhizobiales bacterium]|nr:ABC transporter permease subunit [Hyphomicrobiales bacterium]